MPAELQSIDDLTDSLLERTYEVYRKGSEHGMIKYKFRTKKTLFTLKVEQAGAAAIESRIEGSGNPIEIVDI
ncbi:MAG: hypothetical protein ACXAE3_00285 [Candidatus Kariarchaeaceae archaeon]|jgi:hypothetical protein